MRARLGVAIMAGILAMSAQADASLIVANLNSFTESQTVVSFDGLGSGTEITNQFAGVNFAGGLFASAGTPDALSVTGSAATADASGLIVAEFDAPVTRVGFHAVTSDVQNVAVNVFSSAGLAGNLTFDTGSDYSSFVGIQYAGGIERLEFEAAAESGDVLLTGDSAVEASGNLVIGDFRFDGAVGGSAEISPMPEPSSIALCVMGGFGLLMGVHRRRTRQSAV